MSYFIIKKGNVMLETVDCTESNAFSRAQNKASKLGADTIVRVSCDAGNEENKKVVWTA